MRATVRQIWHSNRFEIAAMVVAVTVTAISALYFTAQLNAHRIPLECLAGPLLEPDWCEEVFRSQRLFFEARQGSDIVMGALFALPLLIGAIFGALLVARDVERRTTQFAWTVGTSRRRWVVERVVVLGLLALLLLVVLAISGHVLAAARDPDVDPLASFTDFGARGLSVISRGVIVFALSALFGAVLGRQLPALLCAGALSLVIAFFARPLAVAVQPAALIGINGTAAIRHAVVFDGAWLAPDGTVLTLDEGLAMVPAGVPDPYDWLGARYQSVSVGIEGSRYPLVEAETAVLAAVLALVGLAACVVVVEWRRIT